jgi:hypothetical protein
MSAPIKLAKKSDLLDAISAALSQNQGFAMGKLGFSEQLTLLFHLACQASPNPSQDASLRPIYLAFKYHAKRQTGIFPTDISFLVNYASFYANMAIQADFLGLFGSLNEEKLARQLVFKSQFVNFTDTEPDRSLPYDNAQCYLRLFQDKKILIIAPFASFAQKRANQHDFEATWQKISAHWFNPSSVQSLDIPYSFLGQTEAFNRFENSIFLYEHLSQQINALEFDVALIAAGSLAIPLAMHIKNKNKVTLSLGGHLKALFGILGARWERDEDWRKNYINESWVRLPNGLIPNNAHVLADQKAYW